MNNDKERLKELMQASFKEFTPSTEEQDQKKWDEYEKEEKDTVISMLIDTEDEKRFEVHLGRKWQAINEINEINLKNTRKLLNLFVLILVVVCLISVIALSLIAS